MSTGYDETYDAYDAYDAYDDDQDGYGDGGGLGEALAEVLSDDYAAATPADLDLAVADVLDELSPAEAFGFGKALRQLGGGAGKLVSDPAFAQIAGRVLPVAGAAAGTAIGGPLGTAVGTQLGSVAARSLPQPRTTPAAAPPAPSAGGGSVAATQAAVLTQHPTVAKGLLAMAMGEHGKKTVDGVPVAALMSMLSSVFGRAAADADELMYLGGHGDAEEAAEWGDDDSLYTALVDADNAELREAVSWP
ncbi:hypothetical protein E1212_07100 [Jiangella ureilytica]|uniref:Uncharacterized protein n=1 Tax=Jiangella ureilytica TaxID=2530374 RepID=A0A4R4RTE3_9ACTN|nr:hypothetical protein [Jiangella ureilytica]TDC52904.1 hypothetical protein E1212_07100 [Jiangella ureilytica]